MKKYSNARFFVLGFLLPFGIMFLGDALGHNQAGIVIGGYVILMALLFAPPKCMSVPDRRKPEIGSQA